MKILHITFGYYPDPVGGTEVYVAALCHELQLLGIEAIVAAPDKENKTYLHNGVRVLRYATLQAAVNIRSLYGEDDPIAYGNLRKILEDESPHVLHIHAFTRAVPLAILADARNCGILTVFTYHTPTASCIRGTLLRWGTEPCDGKLDLSRCTQCRLESLGLNRVSSRLLAGVPATMSSALCYAGLHGGIWTALRMRELVSLWLDTVQSFMSEVDRVITLCNWIDKLLRTNNVSERKLVLVRHGLGAWNDPGQSQAPPRKCLRIVCLGRIDPTKGIHILLRALREIPDARLELDVFAVNQDSNDPYMRKLEQMASRDSRVRLLPPISNTEVVSTLRNYDVLAVPSQGLETGPLVVLEAFAAGIPVLGSDLGGIAELVDHGINGLLIPPTSTAAWSAALDKITNHPELLLDLRRGVQPPRTMSVVADEMLAVYRVCSIRTRNTDF